MREAEAAPSTPSLRRAGVGLLGVSALVAAVTLLPLEPDARRTGLLLVPLMAGVTGGLEWLGRRARDHAGVERALGTLLRLGRRPLAGYYAVMGLLTFARLEVESLRAAVADAESVPDFVVGELPSCSIEAVFNLLSALVWFLEWLGRFPVLDTVLILAGTVVAFRMARWMFLAEGG